MVINGGNNIIKNRKINAKDPTRAYPASSSELIKNIASLKRRSQPQQALETLHKIAVMVKPLMKKRGLTVGSLCEFFPKNNNLLGLNVNHGVKINLRLRQPYDDTQFLPLESILGTMLHELTHNKHGPHDERFYGYLRELTTEMEDLLASGYTGDGFYSQGSTLGGRNLNTIQARKQALDKANQRISLSHGTGQRLGGRTAGEAPALLRNLLRAAAEQRVANCGWCTQQVSEADLCQDDDDLIEIGIEEWNAANLKIDSAADAEQQDHSPDQQDLLLMDIIDLTKDP